MITKLRTQILVKQFIPFKKKAILQNYLENFYYSFIFFGNVFPEREGKERNVYVMYSNNKNYSVINIYIYIFGKFINH